MDMAKIDDWLSAIPSPYTRKTYKAGIKKFEVFYGEGIETLIENSDNETGRIIEKFYVWLKDNGHGQNTCRNLVNSPIQFLKFFGNEPKYRKSLGMYKTVPTTRDHRAKIQEIQEMAKLADLREQILLEIYLLGLRIGDVSALQWRTFDVSGECPIPIQIMTRKEEVVARSFVTEEFKSLLEKYLPLLDKSNKYLFQSKRKSHLSTKQVSNIFKKLVERAGIHNHGLFRWHTGRKLILRTCAELGISSWSAKLIVGKSIPASDDTYIHDAELKGDFLKIAEVLRLFPKTTPQAEDKLKKLEDALRHVEGENMVFKTRIDMIQKDFQDLKHVEEENAVAQKRIDEMQKDLLELKKTVDKLYPKELTRCIINEKGELEEYTETFDDPEEYLEGQRKFMKKLLLRNKSEKDKEKLKNAEFVWDETGKMTKEEIEAELLKLKKKRN